MPLQEKESFSAQMEIDWDGPGRLPTEIDQQQKWKFLFYDTSLCS
jgi:hypothetical protein